MAKKRLSWQQNVITLMGSAQVSVFSTQSLFSFLSKNWEALEAPNSLTPNKVLRYLIEIALMQKIVATPADGAVNKMGVPYPEMSRYSLGNASPYQVALSLRTPSYFTHTTAMHLHGLTLEIPKTIYVNREQSPKPKSNITSQEAINRAFASKPRTSNYIYTFDDYRIVLLNGQNTGMLEVSEIQTATAEFFPVTKLERTLIDSVVRPAYSGGIYHVREAFANAKDRISLNVLLNTLKKLDFTYPYHQAIGFLLERCGYPKKNLVRLKELGLNYDFYLDHQLVDAAYDPSWRLYYPKGF